MSAERFGIFPEQREDGQLPETQGEASLTQMLMLPVCASRCAGLGPGGAELRKTWRSGVGSERPKERAGCCPRLVRHTRGAGEGSEKVPWRGGCLGCLKRRINIR